MGDIDEHKMFLDIFNRLKTQTTTLKNIESKKLTDIVGIGTLSRGSFSALSEYTYFDDLLMFSLNPIVLDVTANRANSFISNEDIGFVPTEHSSLLLFYEQLEFSRHYQVVSKQKNKELSTTKDKSEETNISELMISFGIRKYENGKIDFLRRDQEIYFLQKKDLELITYYYNGKRA